MQIILEIEKKKRKMGKKKNMNNMMKLTGVGFK